MFSPARSPGLQRDRAELRQHLVRLRVGDPRDVADREHLGVAGEAQVRPDGDAVASLELDAERRCTIGLRLQARAPDERVRVQHRARLRA